MNLKIKNDQGKERGACELIASTDWPFETGSTVM
jgi:hypothetical protein